MTRHGIERLPVVDEKDRLVDIVSRRDPLQVLLRSAEEIWQAVRREVFADALRLSPRSPKSPSTTVRSRSPGSWKAAQRRRRVGPTRPLAVSSTSCTTSSTAFDDRHTQATGPTEHGMADDWLRGSRAHGPHPLSAGLAATGGKALGHGRDGPPIGSVAPPAAGPAQRGPHPGPLGAAARRNVSDTDQRGPAADHRRAHRRDVLPDGEPVRMVGRRDRTLQLMRTDPARSWRACEITRGSAWTRHADCVPNSADGSTRASSAGSPAASTDLTTSENVRLPARPLSGAPTTVSSP